MYSKTVFIAVALAAGALGSSAWGALQASAAVTATPLGGGIYHYTIALHNTGTTTNGTFWFAWVPGGNFMASVPTNITSPAGWSAVMIGGAGSASIDWTASTVGSRLAAGGTLGGFGFDSADSPAALAGHAVSSPSFFVTTSYVYSAGEFSDAGYQFVASIPTPPSFAAFALCAAGLTRRRARTAALSCRR